MKDGHPKNEVHEEILVKYWLEKSGESLESAISEHENGRLSPAVRSVYYACFYALSALLLKEGKIFKKHSAVRGAMHHEFVKPGKIDESLGRFYDKIFDSRQRGDYKPMVTFEPEQVEGFIQQAKGFVKEMEKLITQSTG